VPNPFTSPTAGPRALIRGRRALLASAIVLTGALVGGCDLQEDADVDRGRALFIEKCGTCHALTEARTAATVGPDLDAAFAAARSSGQDEDTIEGVVQGQIANPRDIEEGASNYSQVFMPANLVTGADAENVAAYVASVAGVEGIEPPDLGGGQEVFTELCSSCHTLAAAGASGTTGPNLDEVLPGQSAKQITTSIRDPEQQKSPGFEGASMPPFDEVQLPEDVLQELVDYLLQNAGSGGG